MRSAKRFATGSGIGLFQRAFYDPGQGLFREREWEISYRQPFQDYGPDSSGVVRRRVHAARLQSKSYASETSLRFGGLLRLPGDVVTLRPGGGFLVGSIGYPPPVSAKRRYPYPWGEFSFVCWGDWSEADGPYLPGDADSQHGRGSTVPVLTSRGLSDVFGGSIGPVLSLKRCFIGFSRCINALSTDMWTLPER